MSRSIIMARYGEIALKGRNRHQFEKLLLANIEKTLQPMRPRVERVYGRILIHHPTSDEALDALTRVFGLVSVSRAWLVPLALEHIQEQALVLASAHGPGSFKISTRRAFKGFAHDSPSINREVGTYLLQHGCGLSVDVHRPDFTVHVEVRQEGVYLYTRVLPGPGGLPVGMTGRAILLLSGGIDSPVAGWMSLKRGLELTALHFYSPPYTSQDALDKVVELAQVLASNGGTLPLVIHHFTAIQKAIVENCRPQLGIILMRRMMMRVAERLAQQEGALAIVTGESLGQVASQTLESIFVTNAVAGRPVLRPLISFDKREIMELAARIGTYDISIRPYEDCCTLFVPRHPTLFPRLKHVESSERNLDIDRLLDEATCQRIVLEGWGSDELT